MKVIFRSASKIVFIMMAIASCVGFFIKQLSAEQFMVLASMAFAFYFSNKGESSKPMAGK